MWSEYQTWETQDVLSRGELSEDVQEALKSVICKIQQSHFGMMGIKSAPKKSYFRDVLTGKTSTRNVLVQCFPELHLDQRDFGLLWDKKNIDICLESIRYRVKEKMPELAELYERLEAGEALPPGELRRAQELAYSIRGAHIDNWSLHSIYEYKMHFRNYPHAIMLAFDKLPLSSYGFGKEWKDLSEMKKNVLFSLSWYRPALWQKLLKWQGGELNEREKQEVRSELYSIGQAQFDLWGISAAEDRDKYPVFQGSFKVALTESVKDLGVDLDILCFEYQWHDKSDNDNPDKGIASIRAGLRHYWPDIWEMYMRWDELEEFEKNIVRARLTSISRAQLGVWKMAAALSTQSAPYFNGDIETVIRLSFPQLWEEQAGGRQTKAPASPAMDEDARVDHDFFNGLIDGAIERTEAADREKVEAAVAWLNEQIRGPNGDTEITPGKVRIHTTENIPSGINGPLIGIPRFKGALLPQDLIYAHGVYDETTGELHVYMTDVMWQGITGDAQISLDLHVLAELIDHEHFEHVGAITRRIPPADRHARAAERARFFAVRNKLSPFHTFFLNSIAASTQSARDAWVMELLGEQRDLSRDAAVIDYEKRFLDTVKEQVQSDVPYVISRDVVRRVVQEAGKVISRYFHREFTPEYLVSSERAKTGEIPRIEIRRNLYGSPVQISIKCSRESRNRIYRELIDIPEIQRNFSISTAGRNTVEVGIKGINKGLSIDFVYKHFDQILAQMEYEHLEAEPVDARKTGTVLFADADGTLFSSPGTDGDPLQTHLGNSAASDDVIAYLESGGVLAVTTGSDIQYTRRRILSGIPEGKRDLLKRIMIVASGSSVLATFNADGTLREFPGYLSTALREIDTEASRALDAVYLGDEELRTGSSYSAFKRIGFDRSVCVSNASAIPPELKRNHMGGLVYGTHHFLKAAVMTARSRPGQLVFNPDSIANVAQQASLSAIEEGIEILWAERPELWEDFGALTRAIERALPVRVIKQSGFKSVLVTNNGRYFVKVNRELDNAYEKEKKFFLDYNPLSESELLYFNNGANTFIFTNVAYDNDLVTLFDFMHTPGIDPETINDSVASLAEVLARLHNKSPPRIDEFPQPIYLGQSLEERTARVQERCRALKDASYSNVPDASVFESRKWAGRVPDQDMCMMHGDVWPQNFFVDPWSGKVRALIDAEASSLGTRSKELAKIIITFIDAQKNNPHLIGNLEHILNAFFDSYFQHCDVDREALLRSIPFEMASQLLWYAEGTHRTFGTGGKHWVDWRLELTNWALSQEVFSVNKLMDFLKRETTALPVDWVGGLWPSPGGVTTLEKGETVDVYFKVHVPRPLKTISWLSVGAQLWTDMNHQGIWRNAGPAEFFGFDGDHAVFKGTLKAEMESGNDNPFGVTAKVVTPGGDVWNSSGPTWVKVKPGVLTSEEKDRWEAAIEKTYQGVMFDFDGVLKPYHSEVPREICDRLAKMHLEGIPLAINTARGGEDLDAVMQFLERVKASISQRGGSFDTGLFHLYYDGGASKYDLDAGRGERMFVQNADVREALLALLKEEEFARYIEKVVSNASGVHFIFRGGIDKKIFKKRLAERIDQLNPSLSQPAIALNSDDFFNILPFQATKYAALAHFAQLFGVEVNTVMRVGDQGQRGGVDHLMTHREGGFTVYNYEATSDYPVSTLRNLELAREQGTLWLIENGVFAVPSSRVSSHFAVTSDGVVAGDDIITEKEVQPRMREVLDKAGLNRETATWSGDVISCTVGQLLKKSHEDDFLYDLADFFADRFSHEELSSLSDQWLVMPGNRALKGDIAIARNDFGAVYFHFGMGGGRNLPTVYAGCRLMAYLLENDPDSLERLLRYELNRKEYRSRGRKDLRSSAEVAAETGLSGEALDQVIDSIREYEAVISGHLHESLPVMAQPDEAISPEFLHVREKLAEVHLGSRSIPHNPESVGIADERLRLLTERKRGVLPDISFAPSFPVVVDYRDSNRFYLVDYFDGKRGAVGALRDDESFFTERCQDCSGLAIRAGKATGILHVRAAELGETVTMAEHPLGYTSSFLDQIPKEKTGETAVVVSEQEYLEGTYDWLEDELDERGIPVLWIVIPQDFLSSNTKYHNKDIFVTNEGVYVAVFTVDWEIPGDGAVRFDRQRFFTWAEIRSLIDDTGAVRLTKETERDYISGNDLPDYPVDEPEPGFDQTDRFLAYRQRSDDYTYRHYDGEHSVRRGWEELNKLYSDYRGREFLPKVMEALPEGGTVKVLFLGAGRGAAIIDMIRQYPDLDFEVHAVNKEYGLLFDFEHLLQYLDPAIFDRYRDVQAALESDDPVVAEAKELFDKLHANAHAIDISHGQGLDELGDDFDLALIGNYTLEYIPNQLAVQSALYKALRKGGKLVSYFMEARNIRNRMPVKGAIAAAVDNQVERDAFEIILKTYDTGFGIVLEKTDVETITFPMKYVRFDPETGAELYEIPQVEAGSPHFALTRAGIVAGPDVITEAEVQPEMKRKLDAAALTRETATWSGDVVSFTLGDLMEEESSDEFIAGFKAFMEERFDTAERKQLSDQWFVFMGEKLLDGKVALAENEQGAVYMHFGMGGKQNVPSIYSSKALVDYLLKNDHDSLENLLRYELNRREYRADGGADLRSSRETARKTGLAGDKLKNLVLSIEEAEAQAILAKPAGDIADEIKRAAQELAGKPAGMRQRIMEKVAERFAAALAEEDSQRAAEISAVQSDMKRTEQRGATRAKEVLAELFIKRHADLEKTGAELDAIAISLWEGTVSFIDSRGFPYKVVLGDEEKRLLNYMIGRRAGETGEVDLVLIDLERNVEDVGEYIRESVEALLAGSPLEENGKDEIEDKNLAFERFGIDGTELVHVSRGKALISSVSETAVNIQNSIAFFEQQTEFDVPVFVSREMIERMGREGRKALFNKHGKHMVIGDVYEDRIAYLTEDVLDGILGEIETEISVADLQASAEKFKNAPDNNRVVITAVDDARGVPALEGMTVLPVRMAVPQGNIRINHIMAVARYISDVGREALIENADPQADAMLKTLLQELYAEGEVSADVLDNASFAEILQNPSKLLLPPITSDTTADIESYLRAARVVEAMA